jgi:hypothetical protein
VSDEPTLEALRALAAFIDAFEAPGFVFGEWEDSRQEEPGVWTMPYVTYGPTALDFHRAAGAHGWLRPDVDWPKWAETPEARRLIEDPATIATATPGQLARLLTTAIRGDRFNEGNLLDAFESGHLTAIARRAKALADEIAAGGAGGATEDGPG